MPTPKWAKPTDSMNEEQMRFAIAAECILEMKRKIKGFTKEQHVNCFKDKYREQAARDWDEVTTRLKRRKERQAGNGNV